jgi:hypothetical protein
MPKKLRILDFDIENRPLSYWVPDRPTAEVTAIASCWTDDPSSIQVSLLGPKTVEQMLDEFLARYDEADIVTGHYIRKHDLPILNGQLLEFGRPPLSGKMTSDTKLDLLKKADIPATQEFLGEAFGIKAQKVHMTQADWREANRLTTDGLVKTAVRVMGDVHQHIQLREALLKAGWLGAPKVWRP